MQNRVEIYALIDSKLLQRYNLTPSIVGSYLQELKIPIAQYRDKEGADDEIALVLEQIKSRYHGKLIVNDRLRLIDFADGLHLGQEDLVAIDIEPKRAIAKIRQKIGSKVLGLSTHNKEEIEEANSLELDYIGLGAYRSSTTKSNAQIGGESLIKIARLSRHPVAIIGGVRWEDHFEAPIRYKVLGSALMERISKL